VGIETNGGRMDQLQDGFGIISDAREVEGGRGRAKSSVEFAVLKPPQVWLIFFLSAVLLSSAMLWRHIVSNENGFVASLNFMLTLFDFFGALILLHFDESAKSDD
jgi:hypothetical protein